MEELLNGLVEKVGLDKDTANKVIEFIKENADKVPGWLAESGLKDKLPGGIGNLL